MTLGKSKPVYTTKDNFTKLCKICYLSGYHLQSNKSLVSVKVVRTILDPHVWDGILRSVYRASELNYLV